MAKHSDKDHFWLALLEHRWPMAPDPEPAPAPRRFPALDDLDMLTPEESSHPSPVPPRPGCKFVS